MFLSNLSSRKYQTALIEYARKMNARQLVSLKLQFQEIIYENTNGSASTISGNIIKTGIIMMG